jgi:hypothetical protein
MKLFQKLNFFDRVMAAVSFAELNESDTARGIMETGKNRKKQKRARKAPEKQADNRPRLQM